MLFIGVELLNLAPRLKSKVYVKPTNTGILLHYQSHVSHNWYNHSVITTILDHAYITANLPTGRTSHKNAIDLRLYSLSLRWLKTVSST